MDLKLNELQHLLKNFFDFDPKENYFSLKVKELVTVGFKITIANVIDSDAYDVNPNVVIVRKLFAIILVKILSF